MLIILSSDNIYANHITHLSLMKKPERFVYDILIGVRVSSIPL